MSKCVLYPYFASFAERQGDTIAALHFRHFPCVRINLCAVATVQIFLVNVELHLPFTIQPRCEK